MLTLLLESIIISMRSLLMTGMDQTQHLKTLLERRNVLNDEITKLNQEISVKRELFLKMQGAIEYLNEIGVSVKGTQSPGETPQSVEPEVVAEGAE